MKKIILLALLVAIPLLTAEALELRYTIPDARADEYVSDYVY